MGKLRVLCIHGYRQNESSFRERTGALRKLLKKYVEFCFLSAPHVIPEPQNLSRPEAEQERGWWFSKPDRSYYALEKTGCCLGFEASVETVRKAFEDDGPFDGVLGFSQGAAFVPILGVMRQKEPDGPIQFRFAILVAAFKSLVSPHSDYYSTSSPLDVPSFHVIGATDAVIPAQVSEELAASCTDATVYRHDGGHYIPASGQLKAALAEFLEPFSV